MVGVVAVIGSNWFDGLCICGSVDGLCLCVCGFVVVGLWLKWLVILGFCSDGSVCVALCVEPVLREKERKKKDCWKA